MDVDAFRAFDAHCNQRLRGFSLVSEAGIDIDESIAALQLLTRSYDRHPGFKEPRDRLLWNYRAIVLAGLVAIGSTAYDEGIFWPQVARTTGIEFGQTPQKEFAEAFRLGLKSFGLSRFTTPRRNIGEILMHAGIPKGSLHGFLKTLRQQDSKLSDLTGDGFCSWVGQLSRINAYQKGIDAPTWRFLVEGGEVAADLVDRFLAVLDALAYHQHELTLTLAALPPHLATETQRLLDTGNLERDAKRKSSRQSSLSPQIVYWDEHVHVRLPQLNRQNESVDWKLTLPGHSWSRHIGPRWPGDPIVPAYEPIAQPEQQVLVSIPELELQWTLPIVDTSSQILAFDRESGVLIPARNTLPNDRVWLATPGDLADDFTSALDVSGELQIVEEGVSPYGWEGWMFALVDLRDVRHLQRRTRQRDSERREDDTDCGEYTSGSRKRYVSSTQRPVLEELDPVEFVRAREGAPVYAQRPRLTLPPAIPTDTARPSATWTVTVKNAAGERLASSKCETSDDPVVFDPWQGLPSPLIGVYTLDIQGALGRGARYQIHLVEGLRARAPTRFRWFANDGGLQPVDVTLTLHDQRQVVRLSGDERFQPVVLGDRPVCLDVIVELEHMSQVLELPGGRSEPAIGPVTLNIEELGDATLTITIEKGSRATLQLVAHQKERQERRLTASPVGRARETLAQFLDTAKHLGSSDLFLVTNEQTCRLARIRPRKLFDSAEFVCGELTIVKTNEQLDIELIAQPEFAPWQLLDRLRFPPGINAVKLPERLVGRGPLMLTARLHDPWNRMLPVRPGREHHENQTSLNLPIDPGLTSLEDQFVRWMAGQDECPATLESLEFAVEHYGEIARADWIKYRSNLLGNIAEMTRLHGARLFDVVRHAAWSRATHTRLLVEGWPATAATGDEPANDATWRVSPFLGVLESLNRCGDEQLVELIQLHLGCEAEAILERGTDPEIGAGSFHGETVRLAMMPEDAAEKVWRGIGAVPGPLLSGDQRRIHAKVLFDRRDDRKFERLIHDANEVIDKVRALLQRLYGEHALAPLRKRDAPRDWQCLPAISLALCFIARLAAQRADDAIALYENRRGQFDLLAELAPDFVEQDLVLAELWLHRWEHE